MSGGGFLFKGERLSADIAGAVVSRTGDQLDTSEERRRMLRAEAGTTSASGGHLAPEHPPDPLLDRPVRREPPPRPQLRDEVDASLIDRAVAAATPAESLEEPPPRPRLPAERPRRRRVARRVRRTIRHVDPLSVLKLSFFYYSALLLMALVLVAILYGILGLAGVFDVIEELGRALVVDLDLSLAVVEKWTFLLGVIFVMVGSVVNVFLAVLYNIGADLFGGIEVTFVERDS